MADCGQNCGRRTKGLWATGRRGGLIMCGNIRHGRRAIITAIAGLLAGASATAAQAQRRLRFDGASCNMFGTQRSGEITAFGSTSEARGVVAEICEAVGLPANFDLEAVRDSTVNAEANVIGARR